MRPSNDQLRQLARDADAQRGPSDTTPSSAYVLAGWFAAIEAVCAAIKAEDDHCVTQGDYMLDSDDCIKVARGQWVRPDYSIRARSTP